MESVYNLESKLAVLKEHQKKKSLNVVFGGLLIFTSHIILVILVLTLIISWFNNDNFTVIQILKYHIGKYTLLYLYVLLVYIYDKLRFQDLSHEYKNITYSIDSIERKIKMLKETADTKTNS